MRRKLISILGVMLIAALLIGTGSQAVQATNSQITPHQLQQLDGYNIYFSETGGAASRFDRTGTGLSRFAGLLRRFGATLLTLEWRNSIPADCDLLVVAAPRTDLTAEQTARLWEYIVNGGKLLLLVEAPAKPYQNAFADSGGLFELTWTDMSVRGRSALVATESGETIMAGLREQEENPETGKMEWVENEYEVPVLETSLVTTLVNAEHPITANITGELAFTTARPVEVDASLQLVEATPLVYAPDTYWAETDMDAYNRSTYNNYDETADILRGGISLVGASLNPKTGAQVVMIGDRDFAANGFGLQTNPPNSPYFAYPDNATLLLNAVAWLLDAPVEDWELPSLTAAE